MSTPVTTVRFRASPGYQERLEHSPAAAAVLEGVARQLVKPAVEAVAPHGQTGMYHRSIRVIRNGDTVGIGSIDPFAHLVEFGSINNPAYAPLRRGIRAAGLRLDMSRT